VTLSDFQEVADAADLQTLESRLVSFANDLGFGIIAGAFVVEHAGSDPSICYIGNTPEAFKSLSRTAPLRNRDPVLLQLKRSSAAFFYDQSTYVKLHAGDLWDLQAFYGFKTGIAMSAHLPDRQHLVLGVDREQPLPRDAVALTRMMAEFILFAVHVQLAAQRLVAPQTPGLLIRPLLTRREVEILKWTSEGKSAWAVGRILSISEHTVNFHVQRTLTKLGVRSKYQAAAKARSLGLI